MFNLGIKALVRDKLGRVLILGVSPKEKQGVIGWDGKQGYDIPGGRVKVDEKYTEALIREVREETGLAVTEYKLLTTTVWDKRLMNKIVGNVGLVLMIFEVKVEGNEVVIGEENNSYEWLIPQEAAKKLKNNYPDDFCKLVEEL